MMRAGATVLRVEQGQVWLRLDDRQGGCGRCHEPGGCGATRLTDVFKRPGELVCLPDSLGSREGDRVTIGVPDGAPLRAALLGYVLPVGLMFTLGGLGSIVAPFDSSDANVLAGVVLGLITGVLAGRRVMGSRNWRAMGLTLAREEAAVPGCEGRP